MGVFVMVIIAAAGVVAWMKHRGRPRVTAVSPREAFASFVEADQCCVWAQKAEAAGELDSAFAYIQSAMRHTVIAAHLANEGTPPPDRQIDEQASIIQIIEGGRPFVRSLGINDGLWADLAIMGAAFDETHQVDRHRAIDLLYAYRVENVRVAELYFGPRRTWGGLAL